MNIKSLLIANRAEIALRIIRTARAKGIRTIAVYSDADRDAPHVHEADTAFHIGPAEALHSYLNCLLYTSPSPRDRTRSRMPSSA